MALPAAFAVGSSVLSIGGGLFGRRTARKQARRQAEMARAEGQRIARIHRHNAELDRMNSEEAIRQGVLAAREVVRESSKLKGASKARAGASGADVRSGSVQLALMRKGHLAQDKVMEITKQAMTQSAGFASSAIQNERAARDAIKYGASSASALIKQGKAIGTGTLLSGFGQAMGAMSNISWGSTDEAPLPPTLTTPKIQ